MGLDFGGIGLKLTPSAKGGPAQYGLAVLLVGLALLARLAIGPQELGLPYVTFFPAVALAAVFGGFGPGLLAIALGVAVATFLFIPPYNTVVFSPEGLLSAMVFVLDGLLVSSAIGAMHRYYRDFVRLAAELKETKAAEEKAREAAERANQAKSRFLASASHDLRQPYQALRLYHATLQSLCTDERIDKVLDNMDAAMGAGERLLQSLLDVSTLEAGLMVPRPQSVDLPGVLRAVEASVRPQAESKGLDFRVHPLPTVLRVDPVLLARVLDNLVTNAIRYTERGGILLAARIRNGRPTIQVWDTGIGIAPEHQEAVFEEFFQIGNEARDRSQGVGLGLAVVRRAARLMGLDLSLSSTPGRGTVFTVAFPPECLLSSETSAEAA